MKLYQELKDAIADAADEMEESAEFRKLFSKLVENYMNGMGSGAEIVNVIERIERTEESDEN